MSGLSKLANSTSDPVDCSLAAARDGSYEALGQLFDHYRDYLLRVANEEVASTLLPKLAPSDLVQETFLQAVRDFPRFVGTTDAELRAWLRQVLKNNLSDAQRFYRRTQRRLLSLEVPLAINSAEAQGVTYAGENPSQLLAAVERREVIRAALARLPAEYARVIELRTFAGMTFERVGAELQRSAEAARKLWARAVESLASELERHDAL